MIKKIPLLVLTSFIIGLTIIGSCKKDPVIPTLTTTAITNITINSITSGGVISKDGGAAVTARGVCWGITENPGTSGSFTTDAKGIGSFVSNVTGLTPNTLYHVRAYATNNAGTAYGKDVSFTTTPLVVPALTTTAVTSIGLTTAVSGGTITADGNAAITAKGICWATTATPTISNSVTTDGTGSGSFASNLSGLLPGTTYFLRAYATNSAGTAYGNEVSFATSSIVVPTLTTTAATSISITTAVSGGNITADGGGAISAKGVCWATTANPTISDSKTTDGTGTGSFTSNLTGLLAATTYHVRAYATNSAGTTYGNDISFTTTPILIATVTTNAATSIDLTTAVSGGNITADGGGAISARGVCWATTTTPTILNSITTDGTGTGSFISNLTGLLPGTIYYIRAYATNNAGTAYGTEVSITTTAIGVATLTTTAVTSIGLTSAVSGGNITSDGGGAVTARGVCWATTTTPTILNSLTTDGTGTGGFTSNLSGLLPATTYYVRAYATNSTGTAYGNEVSFTTGQIVLATLTTTAASAITLTTAVSGGNITANGGGSVTARGVCWATIATPTISNFISSDGTGSGVFTSNLSALLPGTTYHVRAYATNSAGTAYGSEITFTTSPMVVPTLTTTAATAIGLSTAVTGGNITSNGGGAITARGTCWATTTSPTILSSKTSDGTGSGIFVSNLTGLLTSTTYYARAYATNSAGTAYGNEISFTTSAVVVPTLTTTVVSSITLTTAVSGGNITADGGGAVTARGVCWATTTTPTILNSLTTNGTGTGIFTSNLSGLLPGTIYYLRAYASNSAGTSYGNEVSFTTSPVALATLTTTTASSITLTTAGSGGNITADGGGAVTARGVCWATTATPTILNSITTDGTGTGIFTSSLTGLVSSTIYYVRAYATNSAGTAYGNQIVFNTINETGTLDDAEGNRYITVKIGTQWWMAENLKTNRYNDNSDIPYYTDPTDWSTLSTPGRCWYNNNQTAYGDLYGALYNWFAVNTGNLCPTGWHVPTDTEFNTLELYLGMLPAQVDLWGWRGTDQGAQLKSTTGWAGAGNGTNTSGFNAVPGGYRYAADGSYNDAGNLTYWWTATEDLLTTAWYRRLDANQTGSYKAATEKRGGKYVRCMKN